MSKRLTITLAIAVLGAMSVAVWQATRSDEPVYRGKTLTSWLKEDGAARFAEAVGQVGTNAIPTLLRYLRAKDSTPKTNVVHLVERLHIAKIKSTPAEFWHQAAEAGFAVLRTNAQAAVPALLEIGEQGISVSSRCSVIQCLVYINPPGSTVIPSLNRWMLDRRLDVGLAPSLAILQFGPPYDEQDP